MTSKKRFSISGKFILMYLCVIAVVVGLVLIFMPRILRQYLISEKEESLDNTKAIFQEILSKQDIRNDPFALQSVDAAARAANICAWICIQTDEQTVIVSEVGDTSPRAESFSFENLSSDEKQTIKTVMEGNNLEKTMNVFPSAFSSGKMISLGYPQDLMMRPPTQLYPGPINTSSTKGAVFLHIATEEINLTSRVLLQIFAISLSLIAIVATIMLLIMGNSILIPMQQLKGAAEAITKGDFSQKVEIRSNDEMGDLVASFNEMATELQEVDTLQSDFIANISHDFRSPLTSIKGYVEAMLDGTIPEESFPKYLQIVLDESNRLTKMTNSVLDLSKIENGQFQPNPVSFDINEMIIKLALSLEQRFNEKQIEMSFQFLQEKLYVFADFDQIERVVYNLLDNALKFTDEKGTITVETSVVNKKALIVVSDTGCGIAEKDLVHVFDRFHKIDKSRGKNKMGTGLGLAIAKQILLNHGEDISVTSKPDEGTSFSFTLPISGK